MLRWLAVGSLAACHVHPPAVTPAPVPSTYTWAAGTRGDSLEAAWWLGYRDPRLDSLVALARAANTDLAAAAARLEAAQAALRGARGALAPRTTTSANATRSRQVIGSFGAIDLDIAAVTLDASWELDLAGRLRADRRAAAADLLAAGYDVSDLRRTITGRVVRGWHDVLGAAARYRATEAAAATLDETTALVRARERAGVATTFDVERSAAAAAETRAQLPTIHAEMADAVGALAVLAGTDVGTVASLLGGARLGTVLPEIPDAGVPADLLRARPDVRRAEWRARAAAARIAGARAALVPSFALGGSVGVNRTNGATAGTWSFGPTLSLAVLDPAARARVGERRAQLTQAEAEWRGVVIAAARDVDVAVARARDESERLGLLDGALRARAVGETLAVARWRAGTTDFRDVLDARRTRLDAEQSLVRQRVAVAQAVAAMYVALGGGEGSEPAIATGAGGGGR